MENRRTKRKEHECIFFQNTATEKIYILLGYGCNLRCKYCYHNNDDQKFVDQEINEDIFKFISECAARQKEDINIRFFGGEPLLYFDKIKYIVSKTREISNISYSTITNGKAMTEEMANFFNENNFSVTLSWDGHKASKEYRGYDALQENRDNIFQIKELLLLPTIIDLTDVHTLLEDVKSENDIYFERNNKCLLLSWTIVDDMGTQTEYVSNADPADIRKEFRWFADQMKEAVLRKYKTPFDITLISALKEDVLSVVARDFKDRRIVAEGSDNPAVFSLALNGDLYLMHKLPPGSQYSIKVGDIYDNYFVYLKNYFDLSKLDEQSERTGCAYCEINNFCKGAGPGIARSAEQKACKIRYAVYKPMCEIISELCGGIPFEEL